MMKRCVLLLLLCACLLTPGMAQAESAYERVMRTGVIRCGYGLWPPAVAKDPNTGAMSGVIVDLTEAMAAALNLKVEWNSEIDWGQIPVALDTHKIDLHCAGLWADPGKARGMMFSDPLFFSRVDAVARADDTRFDNNPAAINDPSVKIAYGDGEINLEIAKHDFPKAGLVPKSGINGDQGLLMEVANHRADVTFCNIADVHLYNAVNPDRPLKAVPTPRPIRIFPNTFGIAKDEQMLLNMINITVHSLQENGTVDKILDAYKGRGAELFTPMAVRYRQ